MNNSTSSIVLKAFNKHFFQFLDDIMIIFNNNEKLQKSKDYFITIKNANPTLLAKVWHTYIFTPYHEEISKGDLTFFFEKDYSNDLQRMHNSDEILKFIDSALREPLKSMDESNMHKCVKHFQLVSELCVKYINESDKSIRKK